MFKSILVPLDGSPFSEHALPMACEIARRAGANLRLVHVHAPSASPIYVEGEPVIDENLASRSQAHEERYLAQIKHQLAEVVGSDLKVTVELLDRPLESMVSESLATFLAAHIATTAPDLVVMTTHGRSGLTRAWLGSVADTLVRLSHTPTLLLRPQDGAPDFVHRPLFKHILILLDGTPLAEQILEPALTFGAIMQAESTLLRVVETDIFPSYLLLPQAKGYIPQVIEETEIQAQNYLTGVALRFQDKEHIHTRVVLGDHAASTILAEAQRHTDVLIACATHGRSGLAQLLLGSVADKVLRGATTPMLMVRPLSE
jgi:nucleotide-binding universal stress UspA family protein